MLDVQQFRSPSYSSVSARSLNGRKFVSEKSIFSSNNYEKLQIQTSEYENPISNPGEEVFAEGQQLLNFSAVSSPLKQYHYFSIKQIYELYNAKCKDLKVEYSEQQITVFLQKIKASCINHYLDFQDQNFGKNAISIVYSMICGNSKFRRLNLAQNNFNDPESIEVLNHIIVDCD